MSQPSGWKTSRGQPFTQEGQFPVEQKKEWNKKES